MTQADDARYVSRGGVKLAAALEAFAVDPAGLICADLGSNVGGFVDCLLQRGAARVYAIDTGYGTLAYRLRTDPRVVVMERTNAMHAALPEPVDLVTIDAGWTRQRHVLPAAARLVKSGGRIVTLIKPHYEAGHARTRGGVLPPQATTRHVAEALSGVHALGLSVARIVQSPIPGGKGNIEFFALLRPAT